MSKKRGAPTVYDVAKIAGVSPATVSRYLNRTTFVSDEKSQNIEAAIREVGYKPNFAPQTTSDRRTMSIGVLVQHPDSPYTSEILNDMEKLLTSKGYSLVISTGQWDKRLETYALEYLANSKVDGVIVVTGNLTDQQLLDFSEKIPVIAVGYNVNGPKIRSMAVDNELAGYMATLHLMQQGHVSIAHIKGLASQPDSHARHKGYLKALREAGIRPSTKLVLNGDFSSKVGYEKTIELLDSKTYFTAIFAANDLTAYGAIKALHDRGLRVPEDVSVIGFDDLPTSEYFTPALTTLRQPIEEIGTSAAQSILGLLNGENVDKRLPPTDLIVRQSTKSIYR
ncbi:substrate-binding domain-containing protein [Vibrio sp. SCSIO 43136]|uniref:LacI family DNA-binding transcriptional regulator n=1 Tax=Vibrio sp. SCSIO 43136 TaxID=2819101 RepID=UPI002074AC31|nr:substrate-binding domain-containing protein [Vibrio sp. SCSIO 43136]USD65842.1 substrate-binding domain-containing protein [Vibrio sp. SCSIO 43136]